MDDIKEFAWQQMDAMWHNQSEFNTYGMVQFTHKGYTVVNPWMDEKTDNPVDPYEYYGKKKTDYFIKEARKRIEDKMAD